MECAKHPLNGCMGRRKVEETPIGFNIAVSVALDRRQAANRPQTSPWSWWHTTGHWDREKAKRKKKITQSMGKYAGAEKYTRGR